MEEKTGLLLAEVDGEARRIFIDDSEDRELLEFLVDGLGNVYDTLTSKPEPTPENVENLVADFNAKLNERLTNFTVKQRLTIAKEFSKRAQMEFFARVSAEQRAEARSGRGPFLKWVFVYQNVIGILAPSSCDGCGEKCGGHTRDGHKCDGECGKSCGKKNTE
ncbi:MAG: hypothetical protein HY813_03230 [Candidatus Portnoybacteria bacterium]|nr:hypothetical protein [Candidatus Portnoybacteria bacterium]